MKPALLFTVELAFQIKNRGCVLAPGPNANWAGPPVRVGSPILLRMPDGGEIRSHIRGLEHLNYGSRRPEKLTLPILLPAPITKEQVPPGTEVHLLQPDVGDESNGDA
ncbi:hypothetical protein KAK11_08300 [Ideonella paludis]|uniref:Uncharacterized protein n=1 Tax=Ideonella paludis TaxID=1233411 RepID=A0ABS5DW31_9BURK|nr:hypothetical protein [Ideonella paludis]